MKRSCIEQYMGVVFASLALLFAHCGRGPEAHLIGSRDSTASKDSTLAKDSSASVVVTYEQAQGKLLYDKYCAVCHGTEGKGDGFNAFNLDPKPRDLSDKHYMSAFTQERLYQTIALGGGGVNKTPSMPAWGGRLTRQQILYVMEYVRSLSMR